ncbi:PAS domain-containing protein [Croceicoccus sediminis]|uniref:PAS domain-containing protein n=1 Tax=Croceicoccus sediminis TaxID=2571150 RepID=UPI0011834616
MRSGCAGSTLNAIVAISREHKTQFVRHGVVVVGETLHLSNAGVDDRELVWAILDQSPDCIKVLSLEGDLEYMNPNGRHAMQIDDFAAVAGRKLLKMWPEESRAALTGAIAEAAKGRKTRFEAYCPTAKGEDRWWEVYASPIRDKHGWPAHVLCTSRDITRHRQRDDTHSGEAELIHKASNQLALIGALARISLGNDAQGLDRTERLMERLDRLNIALGLSAKAGSNSLALADLLDGLCAQMKKSERFSMSGALCGMIDAETARTIAIVLGELDSNAHTHGALSGRGGKVDLRVDLGETEAEFIWREWLDVPLSKDIVHGTGLRLVMRMSAALPGPATHSWDEDGLMVSFRVPLAQKS